MKPADIEVFVAHPFGDAWISLDDWIRVGPGPRPLVAPTRARDRHSGAPLPMRVVPLRYRNNLVARALVRLGLVAKPWP